MVELFQNVINETMINNVDNKDNNNDNTITYIFIGLFVVIVASGLKVKNYLKNYLKKYVDY